MAKSRKRKISKRTAKTPKPKRKTPQTKSSGVYKKLTGQNGKTFQIFKARTRFKKSLTLKKADLKSSLDKQFNKRIASEFRRQFKKHGKKGQYKILRVSINHNVKGKRLKNGFSGYRTRIKTEKDLELALNDLYVEMSKAFERYLKRKDYRSLTIKGVSMEVSEKDGKEDEVQSKPSSSRKRKKK